MTNQNEPQASRPSLPEGYGVPASAEGLLPWSFARERLEQAQNYWICTASPSGKPHATPLWGVWVDDSFYFDGGMETRWGRNLAANPQIVVHLESGGEVVIVEGSWAQARELDPALFARIVESYGAKYNYRPDSPGGLYVVRPRAARGWSQFPKDVTRWRFA
jgi:hypothetical protein